MTFTALMQAQQYCRAWARTATPAIAPQTNFNGRGVHLYLNVSSNASAAGIVTRIVEFDPVSGATRTLAVASAVTTTGLFCYSLYPSQSNDPNWVNGVLPRGWAPSVTHLDEGGSVTYSLGAALLVQLGASATPLPVATDNSSQGRGAS